MKMSKNKKANIKNTILGLIVLAALLLGTAEVEAGPEGFTYPEEMSPYGNSESIEIQHNCLTLMVYLETQGEPREGWEAVSMAIINRMVSKRYPDNICDVITQKSQFEPMQRSGVKEALKEIKEGNTFAGMLYAEKSDKWSFNKRYHYIERITYTTMMAKKEITEKGKWLQSKHFYSPKSLEKRGLSTPRWISRMIEVASIGDHVFLREVK